jgi:tetratricopeptide (TPR) repeat protein
MADPAPGVYFFAFSAPRPATFDIRASDWLLFCPWECDLFKVAVQSDTDSRKPEEIFSAPPIGHFQTLTLDTSNPSKLPRGFGPWHSVSPHAISATTSLHLPAGSYRLYVDPGAGCCIWVDSKLIYDGWDKAVSVAPVVEFKADQPRAIKVQRWSRGGDGFSIAATPLDAAAEALNKTNPGWRYYTDSDIEKVDGDMSRGPANTGQRHNRQNLLCREGRFQEASQELARLIAADPTSPLDSYRQISLLAYLNHAEAYRALCRDCVKRFADHTDGSIVQRIAQGALLIDPEHGGLDDLTAVAPLVEKSLASAGRFIGFFQLAKGLLEYRQGHNEAAVEWLAKASNELKNSKMGYPAGVAAHAMALWKAGQHEKALARFKEAEALMQKVDIELGEEDLAPLGVDTWLVCKILHREAASMIQPPPTSAPATQQ